MPYQKSLIEGAAKDVLDYGFPVEFMKGWQRHGSSIFAPRGHTIHHDASRGGSARETIKNGRQGLSGPLGNYYTERDATLVVIAAGRANHAGRGSYKGLYGNDSVVGTEQANNGSGEEYSDDQIQLIFALSRALANRLGSRGVDLTHAHWEWTARKIDPAVDYETGQGSWDMDVFRNELRKFDLDVRSGNMQRGDKGPKVKRLQWRINQSLHNGNHEPSGGVTADGIFGKQTEKYVKHMQNLAGYPTTGKLDDPWELDYISELAMTAKFHD